MTTTYITEADLLALWGPADYAFVTGSGASVAAVLAAVNALVDSYIPHAFKGQLGADSLALQMAAATLTRSQMLGDQASETQRDNAKLAMRTLERFADSKVALPLTDDPATPEDESQGTGAVWFQATESPLKGW